MKDNDVFHIASSCQFFNPLNQNETLFDYQFLNLNMSTMYQEIQNPYIKSLKQELTEMKSILENISELATKAATSLEDDQLIN